MTRDFTEVMAQRTDRELAEILTTKRHEYQDEALKAAQAEFEKRKLDVNTYVTVEDMKQAEDALAPTPREERKFNLLHKILTFILPILITMLWGFLCESIPDALLFKALSLPIVIVLQVLIFRKLNSDGYILMALEFKKWTLNSWIFFVALFVLTYIFETMLESA